IRPFWTVRDVFENQGVLIEARPNAFTPRDEILITTSSNAGTNKAPSLTIYFLANQGWRAAGQGSVDFADYPLRRGDALILRRRNPADLSIATFGAVSVVRSVNFVPGGDGVSANDSF